MTGSVFMTVAIAFERYYAVRSPVEYSQVRETRSRECVLSVCGGGKWKKLHERGPDAAAEVAAVGERVHSSLAALAVASNVCMPTACGGVAFVVAVVVAAAQILLLLLTLNFLPVTKSPSSPR